MKVCFTPPPILWLQFAMTIKNNKLVIKFPTYFDQTYRIKNTGIATHDTRSLILTFKKPLQTTAH